MANQILLCVVADTFFINGRGLVIVPGIPYPSDTMRRVGVGEAITLVRPDGSEIKTSIGSIEMINRKERPATHAPFVAGDKFAKEDVPVGTEVWLLD